MPNHIYIIIYYLIFKPLYRGKKKNVIIQNFKNVNPCFMLFNYNINVNYEHLIHQSKTMPFSSEKEETVRSS